MERQEFAQLLKTRGIAPNLHHGILYYIYDHGSLGHYLTAVFSNDLFETIGRADRASLSSLAPLIRIIYSYADGRCHGSKEKVRAWQDGSYLAEGELPPLCFEDLHAAYVEEYERDRAAEDKMDSRWIGE